MQVQPNLFFLSRQEELFCSFGSLGRISGRKMIANFRQDVYFEAGECGGRNVGGKFSLVMRTV